VRDFALRLVERGAVQVAASDGHGEHRPATIGRELREAGIDPALAMWLAHDVPAALLAGEPVPARPALPESTARGGAARAGHAGACAGCAGVDAHILHQRNGFAG
jgi:hypothetical protein